MQDQKMQDQKRAENTGLENEGPCRIWKMKDHDVSEKGCKMSRHQEKLLKGSR